MFKRLDAEFIRQIDREQVNGNESTRNGHVLMSLAEAMVETRIGQLQLKSPSAPTASDQRLNGDTGSAAGDSKVRSQLSNDRTECQDVGKKGLSQTIERDGSVGQTDDVRDGRWFLSKVDETCDQIRKRIKETEALIGGDGISDEMEGKVRAVIGKADLLMRKKLAQFRELCLHNIVSYESPSLPAD